MLIKNITNKTMKNFITTFDYTKDDLAKMLDDAKIFKLDNHYSGHSDYSGFLEGKVLTTVFYNPSLRTLMSFQTGMQKLGGICNVLDMSGSRQLEYEKGAVMDGVKSEHIKEFVEVVCSYSDVIAARKSDFIPDKDNNTGGAIGKDELLKDLFFEMLLEYATVPVINMESNMYHPCQGMGDMLTMQEALGNVSGKKYVLSWAQHPKPLPLATPHSQIAAPCIFGMDVTLVCPSEFNIAPEVFEKGKKRAEESGGSFKMTNDLDEALKDADIVCAKSWLSLELFGDWDKEAAVRAKYSDWQITKEKMALTNDAKFMHCLPVRRNVVVSDEVLDSKNSIVIQEAENRMWAQMGIIKHLLN